MVWSRLRVAFLCLFPWYSIFMYLSPVVYAADANTTGVQPQPRIIGGNTTPPGRFPYVVIVTDRYFRLRCGGILIAPNVVLTAAHCQSDILAYAITGRNDQRDNTKGQIIRVSKQLAHPDNDFANFINDFHLLLLERPSTSNIVQFNFDKNLPRQENIELVAVGFGDTKFPGGARSNEMNQVTLLYVPNMKCQKMGGGIRITDDMLCTTFDPINGIPKDFCFGDSGSALVQLGDSVQNDLLIGVLSWGGGCADPNFPGVSARTSAGADWIRSQTCIFAGDLAPTYLNCGPPPTPFLPPADTIPVLVYIVLDSYPKDISWELVDITLTQSSEIIKEVEPDTYDLEDEILEQFYLLAGHQYRFTIEDSYGDGLTGTGTGCFVVLGESIYGESLVSWQGRFFEHNHTFTLAAPTEAPTPSPSFLPSLRPSFSPSIMSPPVTTTNPGVVPTFTSCRLGKYMEFCNYNWDCCSGRCLSNVCRTSATSCRASRAKLAGRGRGGAAGLAQKARGGCRIRG